MPFKSERQRKYVHAAANRGEKWAIKFLRDSGEKRTVKKILEGKR